MWGRDREGGGDRAPRAKLLQRADSENQESWSDVGPASDWKQPLWLLYPPPCPSPAWGEGTLWHSSSHLSHYICVRVSTCIHARALSRGRTEIVTAGRKRGSGYAFLSFLCRSADL